MTSPVGNLRSLISKLVLLLGLCRAYVMDESARSSRALAVGCRRARGTDRGSARRERGTALRANGRMFASVVSGERFCSRLPGQWQDSVLGLSWSLFLYILFGQRENGLIIKSTEDKQKETAYAGNPGRMQKALNRQLRGQARLGPRHSIRVLSRKRMGTWQHT